MLYGLAAGVEVHPVNAGDEGQRDEDGRDDGEDLHHLVGRLGEGVEVDVAGAADQVAVGLGEVGESRTRWS